MIPVVTEESSARVQRPAAGPLLLIVHDFHDEFTADDVRQLRVGYDLVDAGRLESVYGALPVCTLLTYHDRTLDYFIVRGRR